MDLELAGKVAIVTGGSAGIGKATARALVREGMSVVLAARDKSRLDLAARDMSGPGITVVAIVCDTTSDDSVASMAATVVERLGRIDVLVNAAARPGFEVPREPVEALSVDTMWAEMNVKVMGYIRCNPRREAGDEASAIGPDHQRVGTPRGRLARRSGASGTLPSPP